MRATIRALIAAVLFPLAAAGAQQSLALTRSEAIAAAVERGPRSALTRADTALASAQLLAARAVADPMLSATYTKDAPSYHVTAAFPLDFLTVRGLRVQSAEAARMAARFRFTFDRALLALAADTSYTRALAAQARVALSRRNAEAADSLRRIAGARRDAGDASDFDVELAIINAGQQANLAAGDSLTLTSALLDLQLLTGTAGDEVRITLTDTLAAPVLIATIAGPSTTLPVLSATASLDAADLTLQLAHRSRFFLPELVVGFDTGDRTSSTGGLLPVIGFSLPLPLFSRNRGPIAVAKAERERADAELSLTRNVSRSDIVRAQREATGALGRVARDRILITSAERVATMSLAAYREGAAPLTSVLEAQRNARDVLGQYIDDVASALIASATLHALLTTPTSGSTP
jgi:cobalt-zinc-cadmium efflux system outer membrane protein